MVPPISNPCYDVFVLPYQEGAYNIRDAFKGTKINLVAQNILPGHGPAPAEEMLTVGRQIAAFFIGMILITPIVNMIAMAILRNVKNDFLHPLTVTNPNPPPPPPRPPVPPRPPAPALDPMSPEMFARKQTAEQRLVAIEAMVNGQADPFVALANQHFQVHPDIVGFNLDAFLEARCPGNNAPIENLLPFVDWADVRNDGTWQQNGDAHATLQRLWGRTGGFPSAATRDNYEERRLAWFTQKLDQYGNENPNDPRYRVIKARLQNILAYFTQERARVVAGSAEETALKESFRNLYKMFIDATHNCVDQVIAQLETYAVDVAVQANTAQNIPMQQRLFNQTCLALHNHRKNLITGILSLQDIERAQLIVDAAMNNDDEMALAFAIDAGFTADEGYTEQSIRQMIHDVRNDPVRERVKRFTGLHMADWQRIAMRQIAQDQGLQGDLVNLEAGFNNNAQGRERVRLALAAFRNEYKPSEYLLKSIAQPVEGDVCSGATTLIMEWAKEHYGLDAEYNADYPADAIKLDERLVIPDPDEIRNSLTMGGSLSAASCALMMEQTGLIAPRVNPAV